MAASPATALIPAIDAPATFVFEFSADLERVLLRGPGGHSVVYFRMGDSWWENSLGEHFPQPAALDMLRTAAQRMAPHQ